MNRSHSAQQQHGRLPPSCQAFHAPARSVCIPAGRTWAASLPDACSCSSCAVCILASVAARTMGLTLTRPLGGARGVRPRPVIQEVASRMMVPGEYLLDGGGRRGVSANYWRAGVRLTAAQRSYGSASAAPARRGGAGLRRFWRLLVHAEGHGHLRGHLRHLACQAIGRGRAGQQSEAAAAAAGCRQAAASGNSSSGPGCCQRQQQQRARLLPACSGAALPPSAAASGSVPVQAGG